MTKKGHSFFRKKLGCCHQLPHRVTPTLLMPLCGLGTSLFYAELPCVCVSSICAYCKYWSICFL